MTDSSNDAINAAQASLDRSRANSTGVSDTLVKGAAIGAIVSLPIAGVGLLGGAAIGAGVALIDKLTRD